MVSMDRGAWRDTVHGVSKESDMTEQLTLNTGLADNPPLERNDSSQKGSKIEGRFSTYL